MEIRVSDNIYRKEIIIENLIVHAFLPKTGRNWNV